MYEAHLRGVIIVKWWGMGRVTYRDAKNLKKTIGELKRNLIFMDLSLDLVPWFFLMKSFYNPMNPSLGYSLWLHLYKLQCLSRKKPMLSHSLELGPWLFAYNVPMIVILDNVIWNDGHF